MNAHVDPIARMLAEYRAEPIPPLRQWNWGLIAALWFVFFVWGAVALWVLS